MKSPLFTQKSPKLFVFLMTILWFISCDNSSSLEEVVISDTPTEEEMPPEEETPPPSDTTSLLRINSGGGEVTVGDRVFQADQYFRGNSEPFTNPSVTAIDGTEEDEIFLTERNAEMDLESFGYEIPITDGTYTLNLFFAEIWFGAPDGGADGAGNRVFNIDIEGETRLMGFDINNEVGTTTAITQTFTVNVQDGRLNFELIPSINRPKISGFEIIGTGSILDETASGPSDPVRINSGGNEVSFNGVTFLADTYFIGDGEPFNNPSVTEISGTDNDQIYLTERNSNRTTGFGYEIPLNNGNYTINLHFAEIWWGAPDGGTPGGPGNRVFSVAIEREVLLMDFDISAEAGSTTAIVKTFVVEIRDGLLNLDFITDIDRPKISAIEVIGNP
ncbi:malectin domain-containing carbohydrate-binding protein [Spongiimicrobium salis]|uniref:malectin domain-containing carbohydrate-binding protein n=1 Tax=Spongiimicrobium salis TaxID=1667022 RepID=UPI00374CEC6B